MGTAVTKRDTNKAIKKLEYTWGIDLNQTAITDIAGLNANNDTSLKVAFNGTGAKDQTAANLLTKANAIETRFAEAKAALVTMKTIADIYNKDNKLSKSKPDYTSFVEAYETIYWFTTGAAGDDADTVANNVAT